MGPVEYSDASQNQTDSKNSKHDLESKIDVVEVELPFRHWSWKRISSLFSLFVITGVSQLPLFLISGSLAATVADIGGATTSNWVPMVNSIAFAAVAPFTGALSDLVGRRYVVLFGTTLLFAGTLIVALCKDMNSAIGGMAVAGAGAGIAQTVGIAGIVELVPVSWRGRYVGLGFMLFLPFGASTAYAQMYAATLTWRIGAWIPMALAAFAFLKLFFTYNPPPRPIDLTYNERPLIKRVDYIGGALSISSIALFMIGFQWAGYNYAWHSAEVISTITAGSALFVIFCIWEFYTPNPMVPLAIFSNCRNVILSFVVLAAGGAGFYAIAGFWIVEVQTLFSTESPYYLAKLYLPFGFSFLIGILIFTSLIDFTRGAIREVFIVAAALMGAGIGGLIAFTQNTPALSSGMSFLAGLGVGGLFVGPIVALTTITSDDLLGTIVGAGLAVRLIGGQVAYAIFYNLLTPKVTKELPLIVGTAVMNAGLPPLEVSPFLEALVAKNMTGIAEIKGITPQILLAAANGVDEAFILGFKEVYYAGVAFSALGLIACLFFANIRKYLTDRVAVNVS